MSNPSYAQIVFNLPLKEPFTYKIPESFVGKLSVGMRVLAPFGPRQLTGYVIGFTNTYDPKYSLKSISDLPDLKPVLPQEILDLTQHLANYYQAGWGEAIRAALPAGMDDEIHEVFEITGKGSTSLLNQQVSGNVLKLLKTLHSNKPLNRRQIKSQLKTGFKAHTLAEAQEAGLITGRAETKRRSIQYLQEKVIQPNTKTLSPEKIDDLFKRSPKQKEIFLYLLEGEKSLEELKERFPKYAGPLKQLREKKLVSTISKKKSRQMQTKNSSEEHFPELPPPFTQEQEEVFLQLKKIVQRQEHKTALLHGVTGSGKTEIYLRSIQLALKMGRTAIMLVPEISLTPQTVTRFQKRFGYQVAILHSGLTQVERYLEWEKIRKKKVSIVVGARSAIFAPFENIGVIVIDEEHDNSYKQDTSPRYHAREAAILRAKHHNALVILGSATPSLESRFRADTEDYLYFSLTKRVGDRLLPTVQLIDMRKERKEAKNFSILSLPLRKAIRDRLERKEQVFLFLNRRGTANYLLCRKCGYVYDCPNCSVSLTFHGNANLLLCHYCNFSTVMPRGCKSCEGEVIRFSGFGTQKLEEETLLSFPEAKVARLDRDTVRQPHTFKKMYREMNSGKIDILIGTQMITKGHDFPNVTLVGVVYADISLHIPDFRSSERSFQLLTQVGGRAGRGKVPGHVIIQAHDPSHPVLDWVKDHDYTTFFNNEIQMRQRLQFPPFTHLTGIEVESEDEATGEATVTSLKKVAVENLAKFPEVELLGPSRAALYRLNNKFRWHLILRSPESHILQNFLKKFQESFSKKKGFSKKIKITLDVDPQNLL